MQDALQITVVGMSLVFGAILLLWGMMILVVRYTQDPPETATTTSPSTEDELLHQAAAVAVCIALIHSHQEVPRFPLPQTALVSAWQAVMRSNTLKERGFKR